MIPILYEKSETRFQSNGICRLVDCIRCEVTEERNGIFECEFDYPVNGRHYNDIVLGRVIFCTHDDSRTGQPFDIYKKSAAIDGVVTFSASHISYRLSYITVRSFSATSCTAALEGIVENSLTENPFTFWTDKNVSVFYSIATPKQAKEMLCGTEGSILDIFGTGEYEWDKYTVKLHLHRGSDTDVEIRYAKNLSDLTDDLDYTGTYNAVVPYWRNPETGEIVTIPEYVVFASEATSTQEPWNDELGNDITDHNGTQIDFVYSEIKSVPLDLSEYWTDTTPTTSQIRQRAAQVLNSSDAWLPNENISIDFVQLWQTSEYENIAPLQRVNLCDTVKVIHPALGINIRIKVIKTVYDVLLDRYSSMELGNPQATLLDLVTKTALTQARLEFVTESQVMTTVERVTQGMSGAYGGYVVTIYDENNHPTETLWMDSPSVLTAVNVIKINKNGIGFSNSGYGGPYTNAWTIDGKLNADFIQAGTLSADLIKTGTLMSFDGTTKFNLDTGYYGSADNQVGVYLKGGKIRFRDKTEDPVGEIASTDIMRIYPAILSSPYAVETDEGITLLYRRAGVIYLPREDDVFIISGKTSVANNDAIWIVYPDAAKRTDVSAFSFRGRATFGYGAIVRNGIRITTGNLNVDNNATIVGNVTITSGNLQVSSGYIRAKGNTYFEKKVTIESGGIEVTGSTKLNNALTVAGTTTLNGTLSATKAATFSKPVTFNDTATFNDTIYVNGTMSWGVSSSFSVPNITAENEYRIIRSGTSDYTRITFNASRYLTFDPDGEVDYFVYGSTENGNNPSHTFYGTVEFLDNVRVFQHSLTCSTLIASYVDCSNDIEADTHIKSGTYMYAGTYVSATSYTTRSDERLKDFIEWDDSLDRAFDMIEPRAFTWKDSDDDQLHLGVSAQATQKAFEDAGVDDIGTIMESEEDGYLTVNYNDITMLMLRRIKKQEQRIKTLEERLEALERIINANS